ncbi:unnamed protein product [Chrysoparadoxa australica]
MPFIWTRPATTKRRGQPPSTVAITPRAGPPAPSSSLSPSCGVRENVCHIAAGSSTSGAKKRKRSPPPNEEVCFLPWLLLTPLKLLSSVLPSPRDMAALAPAFSGTVVAAASRPHFGNGNARVVLRPLGLDNEDLIQDVLSYLAARELCRVSQTCRVLHCVTHQHALLEAKLQHKGVLLGTATELMPPASAPSISTAAQLGGGLATLSVLRQYGAHLAAQRKTAPSPSYFATRQCRHLTSPSQFVTEHMRAILVDWMIEVACTFAVSMSVLHASINLLDRYLSLVTVPRAKFQLLGSVCLLIESQHAASVDGVAPPRAMRVKDMVYICDSQYSSFDVISMYNLVIGATTRNLPKNSIVTPYTAASFLRIFWKGQGGKEGETAEAAVVYPLARSWVKMLDNMEDTVLSLFLADLSLLSYRFLAFQPSTVALSAVFLARVTTAYYAKAQLLITPFAVVEPTNREALSLMENDPTIRPYVTMERAEMCLELPFGQGKIQQLITGQKGELCATVACIRLLWCAHCDYCNCQDPNSTFAPTVLHGHNHMLKGVQEKYAWKESPRASAWAKLGALPKVWKYMTWSYSFSAVLEGQATKMLSATRRIGCQVESSLQ